MPTHDHSSRRSLAFALEGQPGQGPEAVRITAKGRGLLAEQILSIAFERGIKVREDEDFAAILDRIEVDSPIPTAALAAVAEILTRLYTENARLAQLGAGKSTDPA